MDTFEDLYRHVIGRKRVRILIATGWFQDSIDRGLPAPRRRAACAQRSFGSSASFAPVPFVYPHRRGSSCCPRIRCSGRGSCWSGSRS